MFHNTLEKFEFSGCVVLQCVARRGRKVIHNRGPEGRASKLAEKLVEKLDGEAP